MCDLTQPIPDTVIFGTAGALLLLTLLGVWVLRLMKR